MLARSSASVQLRDRLFTFCASSPQWFPETLVTCQELGNVGQRYRTAVSTGCAAPGQTAGEDKGFLNGILKRLTNLEAVVWSKMPKGGSPALRMAAAAGDVDTCVLLQSSGAAVNASDQAGNTALHIAAGAGQLEACAWLINQGADIDIKDKAGLTPLHRAAISNHATVVSLLLDNGANARAKTQGGRTPLYYAQLLGYTPIRKLLSGRRAGNEDAWLWLTIQ